MGHFRKRLSVQQALSHPWMQLGDTKDHGELLTTQFLKEFKYRHKWVVSGAQSQLIQANFESEKLL